MPRSRRQDDDEPQVASIDYEAETPWNQLRNTIDQMAKVSPLDGVKKWYFVRHSTGISYAYLLVSFCVAFAFMAMLLVRWKDDRLLEVTTFESVEFVSFFTDEEEALEGINLPDGMEWYLTPGNGSDPLPAAAAASVFSIRFEQCQTEGGRPLRPSNSEPALACSSLDSATAACSVEAVTGGAGAVPGTCLVQSDPQNPVGFVKGTPDSGTGWRFVRVLLERCDPVANATTCAPDTDADAVLTGASLSYRLASVSDNAEEFGEVPVLRENAAKYTVLGTFQLGVGGSPPLPGIDRIIPVPRFVYESVRVNNLPKVFVDGDEGNFASFAGVDAERLRSVRRPAEDFLLLEARMELAPRRRVVNVQRVNLWDLLGQWWSLFLVLIALGILVRRFNRWHFYKHGEFEFAGLPPVFVKGLLDPFVAISTPCLPQMLDMRETRKADAVGPAGIRAQQRTLAALRRKLDECIRLRN